MQKSIINGEFTRLKGQEGIIGALTRAFSAEKYPHAIMLTGPDGAGKSTLALLLAAFINCREAAAPCGQCLNCRQIMGIISPDMIMIAPETNSIKIDQVREARNKLKYFAREEGIIRICLVEEAHCLTPEGAASLLKILEEPPPALVFILTTPYPSRLPPTILSRCQVYRLQRIPEDLMEEILTERVPEAAPEMLKLALRLGEGVPGRALNVLEDEEWAGRRSMAHRLIDRLADRGTVDGDLLAEANLWASREDLPRMLELLALLLKDGLFAALGCDENLLADPEAAAYWTGTGSETLALALEDSLLELNKIRGLLQAGINKTLAVETAFLQIRGRIEDDKSYRS